MTKTILLTGKYVGHEMLVDDGADYETLLPHTWTGLMGGGRITRTLYAVTQHHSATPRSLPAHRMLLGWDWPLIDHENHNGLDNRRKNLRPATVMLNAANGRRHADGSSQFKGVSWHAQKNRWRARICVDGKRYWLGLFEDELLAAAAYNEAAAEAWGSFAYLNDLSGSAR